MKEEIIKAFEQKLKTATPELKESIKQKIAILKGNKTVEK